VRVGWLKPVNSLSTKEPFVWDDANGRTHLSTISALGGEAKAINNAGTIVGISYLQTTIGPNAQPTLWLTQASGPTALAKLPNGAYGIANAINKSGLIVGASTNAAGEKHAVLWTIGNRAIYDLNAIVPATQVGFAYLEEATAVNSKGDIVGYGRLTNGQRCAFRMNIVTTSALATNSLKFKAEGEFIAPVVVAKSKDIDLTNYPLIQGDSSLSSDMLRH
jgi:probable HAF family extracellular repeat protein